MSVHQAIYLGPFVEHVIEGWRFTVEIAEEISEVLDWNGGVSLPPTMDIDGVAHRPYCFMPYAIRPGGPSRTLRIDVQDNEVADYRDLSIPGEMDWFSLAYRDELERLAAWFGHEGSIRWGLIKWVW